MTTTKPWSELGDATDKGPEHQILATQYRHAMDTAEALGIALDSNSTQVNPSTYIEHEEDAYLSALRHYVELLGGHLEIRAVFPDRIVELFPASDDSGE